MNRKGTERIDEGFAVGVLGGEHGDEEQADRVVAHALKKVPVRALFANDDVLDLTLTTAFSAHTILVSSTNRYKKRSRELTHRVRLMP